MRTTVNNQTIAALKWPANAQNGIVRSFVASRKKYLALKRGFDILLSFIIITFVLSWLTPLIALLIKANSKGPVFFRQKRAGKNGKLFYCLKFRTMYVNDNADDMPALENDERITRLGKFLRYSNLDELPQFINVILGHMSVVGPRPHMVADCVRFSFVVSSYQFRSLMRPGITGLAQVNGCHGITPDYDSIILRYYWDAQYIRKANLWLDIRIISQTIKQSLRNIWKAFLSGRKNRL